MAARPKSFGSVVQSLWYGATLRCPECRVGRLSPSIFSFFTVRDQCPNCGIAFEPARGEFTGAMMFGQGALGLVALMGYFVLYAFMDVPAWVEWAWVLFFAVVFPMLFYRNMKGAWVGLMHAAMDLRPQIEH